MRHGRGTSRRNFIGLLTLGVSTLKASYSSAKDWKPRSSKEQWTTIAAEQHASVAHDVIRLDGPWELARLPLAAAGSEGYAASLKAKTLSAVVPGDVHLDLMRAGEMPDPRIRDNARTHGRWPEAYSWWYRRSFEASPAFLAHPSKVLVFEGLDLDAEIYLNGLLIGRSSNALAPAIFAVSHLLRKGTNEITVRLTSGLEKQGAIKSIFVQPDNKLFQNRHVVGTEPQRLRKPASATWGMDWCDPLPGIGIWRSVNVKAFGLLRIDALHLETVRQGDQVSLVGEVVIENAHPWSDTEASLEVTLTDPDGTKIIRCSQIVAAPGLTRLPCSISVDNPKLWWPNGMGAQPLYGLRARVMSESGESDRVEQQIGLRTIELDQSPLESGSSFNFRVNGQLMFCKGSNWVPADLIPASVTPAHYQKLIQEARNANFNMIRVWGGGIYESDAFYDACDSAGILIWQDFGFSLAAYPDDDPIFVAEVEREANALVRRLRHRPSIALWCGNNEVGFNRGLGRCNVDNPVECSGFTLFNKVLAELCYNLDPHRPYRPTSPFGGNEPNSPLVGDVHGFDSTGTIQPPNVPSDAMLDEYQARFISEAGFLAPPHIATIREYLATNKPDPESGVWKIHTNMVDMMYDGHINRTILEQYGQVTLKSETVEYWIMCAQLTQANLYGRTLEGVRFRTKQERDPCGGLLFWQYNDAWGEIGWSIIDHSLRRKPAFYAFRRAAAPVKVITRRQGTALVTRVINDSLNAIEARVRFGWMRYDGTHSALPEHPVHLRANEVIEVGSTLVESDSRDPVDWFHAAILDGPDLYDHSLWFGAPYRAARLSEPEFTAQVINDELLIHSNVFCHAVHLDDKGGSTLSDNYFDLLPGQTRRIRVTGAAQDIAKKIKPTHIRPSHI